MNEVIRKMPIRVKIILMIMITSTLSLILVGASVVLFDHYRSRKSLAEDLSAMARLIADRSSAAVAFNDVRLAEENLASLGSKPGIEGAWILSDDNQIFAKYGSGNPDTLLIRQVNPDKGFLFQKQHLCAVRPILAGTDPIGTVIISRNLDDFQKSFWYFMLFMVGMLAASWILALILSTWLQKYISKPLLDLTSVARNIAINKDYSQRAKQSSDDEIGLLVKSFNEMLERIETHNAERKQSEEKLQYERLLLRIIIDNLPDAIYTKDTECRKTLANVADVKNMGALSEEDVIGKDDFAFHPRELAQKFYEDDQKVIKTGEPMLNREEYVIGKGRKKWLMTSKLPLRNADGELIGLIGIGRDITESKEAAIRLKEYYDKLESLVEERTADLKARTEELEVSKELAESADRLKSAFLATMSHELRTPLNSIIGFTGILKQGRPGPLNAEQNKQLGLVQNSARHLLSLINDVLDLSKIEAGQMKVNPEVFSINEVIQKVVDINSPLAEEKRLTFTAIVSPDLHPISTDKQRLSQVLVNLANNAIKFTEQGSVLITCFEESELLVIKVTDTGIGIEQDKIEALFKPFIQIDAGTTRKHEGTGLGLSISRKLMNLLGGDIKLESEYGKGSTFIVTLPIYPEIMETI